MDDRCESDISGIAADDSDLSSRSIGDIPLVAGNVVRSYKHRPNASLNTTLTVVALVALFMAVGIGIGHYMGKNESLTIEDSGSTPDIHRYSLPIYVCLEWTLHR